MKNFAWIRAVCKAQMRRTRLLSAIKCASALIAVSYALLMQQAIDAATSQNPAAFWPALGVFACALAMQVVLSGASKWLSESAKARLENALRGHAAKQLLHAGRLPQRYNTGEASTALTSDAACVANSVVSIAPEAASMAVRATAALIVMFMVAPALAVFFLVAGALCVAASMPMRRWLKTLHANAQQAEGSMRSRLQETLESMTVIRSFGAQKQVEDTLNDYAQTYLGAREKRAAGQTASGSAFSFAMQASYLAGFGYGCWGILTGQLSYGTLMALVQLVGQIRTPFVNFSGLFPQMAALSASCERLRELASDTLDFTHPSPQVNFSSLKFSGVTYAYDKECPVLTNFNAHIQAGEFVAISGPSGIGKTTLLALMLGMDKPQQGSIEISFADVNGSQNESIAAHMLAPGVFAYVPQGNMLMSGTIANVVTFGDNVGDEARLKDALRIACASAFVDALPQGIKTELGERGAGLSEGQMQRLAVARALYSNAPVLLLDECTSALDEATERKMLKQLRELDKTVVIVSHRPAAIELCDRVIKLDSAR